MTTHTIKVEINSRYVKSFSATGTWEEPYGGGFNWNDNVRMIATNDRNNQVTIGNGDGSNFQLTVAPEDKIQWIVADMNPLHAKHHTVCMYGFEKGEYWDASLTEPSDDILEESVVRIKPNAFDDEQEPSKPYLNLELAQISVPHCSVKTLAKDKATVGYYLKVLLVDTSQADHPRVLKYVKIDPKIIIHRV